MTDVMELQSGQRYRSAVQRSPGPFCAHIITAMRGARRALSASASASSPDTRLRRDRALSCGTVGRRSTGKEAWPWIVEVLARSVKQLVDTFETDRRGRGRGRDGGCGRQGLRPHFRWAANTPARNATPLAHNCRLSPAGAASSTPTRNPKAYANPAPPSSPAPGCASSDADTLHALQPRPTPCCQRDLTWATSNATSPERYQPYEKRPAPDALDH